MFAQDEVKKLISKLKKEDIKSILNKVSKHDELYINLTDFNKLLRLNGNSDYYDIKLLANYFKDNKIGYTRIIKELKIPKATLSQMLNSGRNIKLSTLNRILKHFDISKNTLWKEN